jgi:hypothetical protein
MEYQSGEFDPKRIQQLNEELPRTNIEDNSRCRGTHYGEIVGTQGESKRILEVTKTL